MKKSQHNSADPDPMGYRLPPNEHFIKGQQVEEIFKPEFIPLGQLHKIPSLVRSPGIHVQAPVPSRWSTTAATIPVTPVWKQVLSLLVIPGTFIMDWSWVLLLHIIWYQDLMSNTILLGATLSFMIGLHVLSRNMPKLILPGVMSFLAGLATALISSGWFISYLPLTDWEVEYRLIVLPGVVALGGLYRLFYDLIWRYRQDVDLSMGYLLPQGQSASQPISQLVITVSPMVVLRKTLMLYAFPVIIGAILYLGGIVILLDYLSGLMLDSRDNLTIVFAIVCFLSASAGLMLTIGWKLWGVEEITVQSNGIIIVSKLAGVSFSRTLSLNPNGDRLVVNVRDLNRINLFNGRLLTPMVQVAQAHRGPIFFGSRLDANQAKRVEIATRQFINNLW